MPAMGRRQFVVFGQPGSNDQSVARGGCRLIIVLKLFGIVLRIKLMI